MKLKEFTDDDIYLYALGHDGKSPMQVFKEINDSYNAIIREYENLVNHRTIRIEFKSRLKLLLDDIVDLHDYCKKSEDDNETRVVAGSLKDMYYRLNFIFDNV